jgi:hypothetical protein
MVDAQNAANAANERKLAVEVKLGKLLKKLKDETGQGNVDKVMGEVYEEVKREERTDALAAAYDQVEVEGDRKSDSEVLVRRESTFPARGYST